MMTMPVDEFCSSGAQATSLRNSLDDEKRKMTKSNKQVGSAADQSGRNQPAHLNSGELAQNDVRMDINESARVLRRSGMVHKAVFNHSVEEEKEFFHDLEEETDIPEREASSRDDPGSPQMRGSGTLKYLIGGSIGLVAILVVVLGVTKLYTPKTNSAADTGVQPSGPVAGSLMGFVDGSVLTFVPDPEGTDNNGQKGFWISLFPITTYQYSLCVESGNCVEIPEGDTSETRSVQDPINYIQSSTDGTTNSGIIGPEIVGPDLIAGTSEIGTNYCAWLNGRVPTDAELASFQSMISNLNAGGQTQIQDDTVRGSNTGGETHIQDDTVRGVLNTGGETHIQDDTVRGLHCILDQPLPFPLFSKTSPYYSPGTSMQAMDAKVTGSQNFCQNGLGYETMDLSLPPDHSIQAWNSDEHTQCQQVDGNRLVCFGNSNSNPQLEVSIQCDSYGIFNCQPGTDLGVAGCSNNLLGGSIAGLEDWERDANGALVPLNGRQLPNGALTGHTTHPMQLINGVIVVESLTSNTQSGNDGSFNGSIASDCPQGYYLDQGLTGCTSLGPPQTQCLPGYHFNSQTATCESDLPGGNYPGCPAGQLFDLTTGVCDPDTTIISASRLIHTKTFQLNLPDCSNNSGKEGGGGGGSGGGCPPGQTYTCEPVCGCAPG